MPAFKTSLGTTHFQRRSETQRVTISASVGMCVYYKIRDQKYLEGGQINSSGTLKHTHLLINPFSAIRHH